jgi:hypothetical protein
MTNTEFLAKAGFKPYGTVQNSWDSFNGAGTVLMQLWQESGQWIRDGAETGVYLRVCCLRAANHDKKGKDQSVGYAGRLRAIEALEGGRRGYAAMSSPPEDNRGPGVWAKHADLKKVYPILAVERSKGSDDIFVILGRPIASSEMT